MGRIVNRFVKNNEIPIEWIYHLALDEIESFKLPEKYLKTLEKRASGLYAIFFNKKKQLQFTYSKDAKKLLTALESKIRSNTNEIRGQIAYKGKVKGKAVIINSTAEFKKMKKGNILLSIMTRPEMIPIIKKASAIVTDEGGITCHAAIISREMKIPCIVGTQTSTIIIKDNDIIEVDAEKGIVRKLR
ncbi:MAG: hypothetical protein KKF89_02130 [Nanoarchaeota archaeon]|nr:hypothetical protein [Nanoarchaeota archaeon]MBU1854492.1 hypothetical protein [Nanoarchaeota archaeon]